MKNLKLLIYIIPIFGLVMTSCDPSVEAPGFDYKSEVTYLPLITLEGGDVELECDATSYTDPGAVASAGGNEIELITNVSGTYFGSNTVDGPDIYSVSYSAFNADSIPATGFRSVFWPPCQGDLVTSIAGVYSCSMTRTPGYATSGIGPILIRDLGDGVYGISDAIGGWYDKEYGYGPDYAATGLTIVANDIAANDFTLNNTKSTLPWGGAVYLTNFSVDSGAGTISMTTEWVDHPYVWKITLTPM